MRSVTARAKHVLGGIYLTRSAGRPGKAAPRAPKPGRRNVVVRLARRGFNRCGADSRREGMSRGSTQDRRFVRFACRRVANGLAGQPGTRCAGRAVQRPARTGREVPTADGRDGQAPGPARLGRYLERLPVASIARWHRSVASKQKTAFVALWVRKATSEVAIATQKIQVVNQLCQAKVITANDARIRVAGLTLRAQTESLKLTTLNAGLGQLNFNPARARPWLRYRT